jgi:hypothetical protein
MNTKDEREAIYLLYVKSLSSDGQVCEHVVGSYLGLRAAQDAALVYTARHIDVIVGWRIV